MRDSIKAAVEALAISLSIQFSVSRLHQEEEHLLRRLLPPPPSLPPPPGILRSGYLFVGELSI